MGSKASILRLLGHEDRVAKGLWCQLLSPSWEATENSLSNSTTTDGEAEAQRGKAPTRYHTAPGAVPDQGCL